MMKSTEAGQRDPKGVELSFKWVECEIGSQTSFLILERERERDCTGYT